MPRAFLGAGWGFPVQPDPATGAIATAAYEQSVRQSVWIILGTAKGERVMRPEFGCDIYDLVFEVNDASTAGRVAQSVRAALLAFEPRIDLVDVQVRPDGDGEVMLLSIDYRVRATNNAFNLVYPFYLESAAT
jgi:uncharacterized protein